MNTKDLYDILCRIPTTYYERTSDGIKYKEWDTEDPENEGRFIGWSLFSEMEDLTGDFCAYVFSDSVCTPLIETAKRKLSLYVEWWDNCKDSPQIHGIISIKLGDFYVVCRQWLSIINEALTADTPNNTTKPSLPKEFESETAKQIFSQAEKAGLMSLENGGYKWNKSKALLAYFAAKVSDILKMGKATYISDSVALEKISWKLFEEFFFIVGKDGKKKNAKDLRFIYSSYNIRGSVPRGYKIVNDTLKPWKTTK